MERAQTSKSYIVHYTERKKNKWQVFKSNGKKEGKKNRDFERHPDLEQETKEYLDSVSDVAEHHLIESVKAGNSWAVRYWLSTRGKNRGYSTKLENTFNSFNPMQTIGIKIDGQPMQEITTGVADNAEWNRTFNIHIVCLLAETIMYI